MKLNYRCASLDTNILIRLIMTDDKKQHQSALNLILNGNDYYVDDYAVMETVYVLTKENYSRTDIAESILDLLSNNVFTYNQKFFMPVFERYLSHPSLSFNDCVLEARAKEKGAVPLWTFDRKFAHQSKTARLLES